MYKRFSIESTDVVLNLTVNNSSATCTDCYAYAYMGVSEPTSASQLEPIDNFLYDNYIYEDTNGFALNETINNCTQTPSPQTPCTIYAAFGYDTDAPGSIQIDAWSVEW